MEYITIVTGLTNVDTGEAIIHEIKEFDLSMSSHVQALHNLLDRYIHLLRTHNVGDSYDTFDLEFRSYRSHKQLELPF